MKLNPTLRSTFITFASFIFVITAVSAWTGPSVSAPDDNVSAPLTISATSQSKTGGLDVGWLSAVGAVKVGYTATACTADLAGSLRWNTGVMEYCNGTVWGPFVGSGTEADPTVLTSVKDGVDWTEITNKPADSSPSGTWCGGVWAGSDGYYASFTCKGVDITYGKPCPSGYNRQQLFSPDGANPLIVCVKN